MTICEKTADNLKNIVSKVYCRTQNLDNFTVSTKLDRNLYNINIHTSKLPETTLV